MINLRIDVDYPYPSRAKSFLCVALRIKKRKSRDYLKNARIIAKMINESPKQVMAYWFFTPYTIPDKELLDLLNPERHEVGLHVATDPYREWKILEDETNRTVKYYTIHGTARLSTQLLWGRKPGETQVKVPSDFPLKNFHNEPTFSLDRRNPVAGIERKVQQAQQWIDKGCVLSMHPEWLFKTGGNKRRRPYYDILRSILDVDKEFLTLQVRKKVFFKIARDFHEYEKSVLPSGEFIDKLSLRDVDILTFPERTWCFKIPNPSSSWVRTEDNVSLLEVKDYNAWWSSIGKKTRNMVRKSEKDGVKVAAVEPSDKLAEGVWKIYNETPIRQQRAFPHYGESLSEVRDKINRVQNSTFIGAFLQEDLIGFTQLLYGDSIVIVSQLLSMQKHKDKAVNNALIAKTVEVCGSSGNRWLMYGRFGNHPSLDRFKESNGFVRFPLTRYYVPLTWKGEVAVRLGLHRELKDALPQWLRYSLIPLTNWVSRNRIRLKLYLTK
ncbi:MAG TPA: hypothetical protein VK536_03170 [Candidatus Limnocylindrales bacterium]|nr:hypothetical protein [Candidatus Limnocylindrales bacterium]